MAELVQPAPIEQQQPEKAPSPTNMPLPNMQPIPSQQPKVERIWAPGGEATGVYWIPEKGMWSNQSPAYDLSGNRIIGIIGGGQPQSAPAEEQVVGQPSATPKFEYWDANTQTWHETGMTAEDIAKSNLSTMMVYRQNGQIIPKPEEAGLPSTLPKETIPIIPKVEIQGLPKLPIPNELMPKPDFNLSFRPNELYVVPEGAKDVSFDANGNAIAWTHPNYGNEIFYYPGSLQYEMGWRTESDRIKGGAEHPYGIYHGNQIPDNTILEVNAEGYVINRYPAEEYAKGNLNAIDNMGMLRFPVKNDVGQEILLNKEQYTKLASAQTDSDRLSVAKEFKLVPDTMTLKEFTGEKYKEDVAKANANLFIQQQENKTRQAQIDDFEKNSLPILSKELQEAYRTGKNSGDLTTFNNLVNEQIEQARQQNALQVAALNRLSSTNGDILKYASYNRNNPDVIKTLKEAGYEITPALRNMIGLVQSGYVMELDPINKYDSSGNLISSEVKYAIDPYKALAKNPNDSDIISKLKAVGYDDNKIKQLQVEIQSMPYASRDLVSNLGITGLKEATKQGTIPYNISLELRGNLQSKGIGLPQDASFLKRLQELSSQHLQDLGTLAQNMGAKITNWSSKYDEKTVAGLGAGVTSGLAGAGLSIAGMVVGFPILVAKSIFSPTSIPESVGGMVTGTKQAFGETFKSIIGKSELTPFQQGEQAAVVGQTVLAPLLIGKGIVRGLKEPEPLFSKATSSPEMLQKSVSENLKNEISKIDTGSRLTKIIVDLSELKNKVLIEARDLPSNIRDSAKIALNELEYSMNKLGDSIKESPQNIVDAVRNASFDTQLAINKVNQLIKDLPDDMKYQANKLVTDATLLSKEAQAIVGDIVKVAANDVDYAANKVLDNIKSTPDKYNQAVMALRIAIDNASQKLEQLPYKVSENINTYVQDLAQSAKDLRTSASMAGKIISNDIVYSIDKVIQVAKDTPEQIAQAVQEAKDNLSLLARDIELTGSVAIKVAFNEIQIALDKIVEIAKNSPQRLQEAINALDKSIYEARTTIKREIGKIGDLPDNVRRQAKEAFNNLEEKISNATDIIVDSGKVAMNDVAYKSEQLTDALKSTPDKIKQSIDDLDIAIYKAKKIIGNLPDNISSAWNASLSKTETVLRDIRQTLSNTADIASMESKALLEDIRYQSEQLPKLIGKSPEVARQILQQIKDDILYLQNQWEYQKRDFTYGVQEAKLTKPLVEQLKNIQRRLNDGSISNERAASELSYLQSSDDWIALMRAKQDINSIRLSETVNSMLETHNIQPSDIAIRLSELSKITRVSGETWEEALYEVNRILSQKNLTEFEKAMLDWQVRASNLPLELREATIRQIKEAEMLGKEFIVEQNREPTNTKETIDKIEKDIKQDENTLDNAERLRNQSTNPDRQKVLDEHIEELKRSIEQKKQQKQVVEKEKLQIPGVKIAEVGKELPAKIEETTKEIAKEPTIEEQVKTTEKPIDYPERKRTPYPSFVGKPDIETVTELSPVTSIPIIKQVVEPKIFTISEPLPSPIIITSPMVKPVVSPEEETKQKELPIPAIVPQIATEPLLKPEEQVKPSPVPEPKPSPFVQPEPSPYPQPKPFPEPSIEQKIPVPTPTPTKVAIPPITSTEQDKNKKQIIENPPVGTVVWIQGRPQYKGEANAPMFKVAAPPYDFLFTTRETPNGYVDEGYTGKGMAFKSIQIIGGLPDKNIENLDLGFARVNVLIENGKPRIEYVQDVDSNVGERSKTVGQGKGQIPIEEWEAAKAQGIPFEDFVASYTGHKEGEPHPEVKSEVVVNETQNEPKAQESKVATETPKPNKLADVELAKQAELESNQEVSETTEPVKAQIGELVTYLEKAGMQVEFVGNKTLHDYAGMNPEAAKTMGWQNRGNEIQIDKNLPVGRQLDNLRHEVVEMDLMKAGNSYADAHLIALQLEKVPLTPTQLSYLAGLGQYKVAHIHKNGNINVEKEGKEYSLTIDGQIKPLRQLRFKPEQTVEPEPAMRKPENMTNWWETGAYQEPKPKQVVYPETKYRGHSILSPDLGVQL